MSATENNREDSVVNERPSTTRMRRSGTPAAKSCQAELSRISAALKKDDFRQMISDYCSEIQNPENRKRHKGEMKELESERGVDIQFVSPEPGFVVKGRIDGGLRCYVNVTKSTEAAEPRHEAVLDPDMNPSGLSWTLPLALLPPREDIDSHGKRCNIYNVLFHADAVYLAQRNEMFRKCIIDTALDTVERDFKVKIDRKKLRYPKEDYKGLTRRSTRRALKHERHTTPEMTQSRHENANGESINTKVPCETAKPKFNTPKYTMKHRIDLDVAESATEFDNKSNESSPHDLVFEIELPQLKSTTRCQLDVTPNSIYFLSDRSNAKYRLKLDFPYTINDKHVSARFDIFTRRLCVILPVVHKGAETRQRDLMSCGDSMAGEFTNITEKASVNSYPGYLTARTSSPMPPSKPFLRKHVDYLFPTKFDCNVLDDLISLVLHVRKVQQESIALRQLNKSVHLQFLSIGNSGRSIPYAFYMQLPDNTYFEILDAHAEAFENFVVLNLNLSISGKSLQCYLAGIDAGDLRDYAVQEVFKVAYSPRKRKRTSDLKHETLSSPLTISEERSRGGRSVEAQIISREHRSSTSIFSNEGKEDDGMVEQYKKQHKKHKTHKQQQKSVPTTQSDTANTSTEMPPGCNLDVAGSSNSLVQPRPCKGILKHYSRYDPQPSISESSSSLEESSGSGRTNISGALAMSRSLSDIPEEQAGPLVKPRKKTVRFNELVAKKIFSHDSTIFEQGRKPEKYGFLDRKTFTTKSSFYEDNNNNNASNRSEGHGGRRSNSRTHKSKNSNNDDSNANNSSRSSKRKDKDGKKDYYCEETILGQDCDRDHSDKDESGRSRQLQSRKSQMAINQMQCDKP